MTHCLEQHGVTTFFSLSLGVKDVLEGKFPAQSCPASCLGGLAVLLSPPTIKEAFSQTKAKPYLRLVENLQEA